MTKAKDLAVFIGARIDSSMKTQRELSAEAGFENENFMSMIRTGKVKIPIRRVRALADALGVAQQDLMERCLAAYHPDIDAILHAVLPAYRLSVDEVAVLRGYRELKQRGVVGTHGVEILPLKPR
jgi:DNA-binding Xre family transcriptional regulator